MKLNKLFFLIAALVTLIFATLAVVPSRRAVHADPAKTVVILQCSGFNGNQDTFQSMDSTDPTIPSMANTSVLQSPFTADCAQDLATLYGLGYKRQDFGMSIADALYYGQEWVLVKGWSNINQ